MTFETLVEEIDYIDIKKENDQELKNVTNNSKDIENGDVFVAIVGKLSDGHKYIDDAIKNGASTVVYQNDIDIEEGINYIKVKDTRLALSQISNVLEDFPSKKMTVVGVTGTNGKTTTATTIYYLMREIYGNATNIGTDGTFIGDEHSETSNTTPDSYLLNRIFNESLEKNIDHVVLEASSHGLVQNRLNGIDFDYGIFTNLSTEHLDYHKTMDNYFAAKMILFENSKNKIVNIDDPYGKKAKERFKDAITYGKSEGADYRATEIVKNEKTTDFNVNGVDFTINSIADYEIYNKLAAIATLNNMGASLEEISEKLKKFNGLPSRFQYVENDLGKNIIIDFAHTPRAFEAIFESIPKNVKTYAVFGIQGDRNTEFRRLIGNACAKNDVFAVITTDDPKFDTYDHISDEIVAGIDEIGGQYERIEDRLKAMTYAIKKANPGDYILMLGKGEEHFIKLHGNEKTPYNEMETVLKAIDAQ
ncbi:MULTISPECIES: UDP-N-acetylmuramoyl-L-alanyl-D-glutamate--2,6-diaminopimelate ligase [Anaerococcus]|uniref:UDP-N-acetylmuramyl-tripeptide synthetase n=1 Tax=Anaerococcus octavius TaxID=54007 RepID=A0A2I1M924_9FIRM|nr:MULTISPECIES: UDP-N-acetylmuramoyl-L-alanyl-D-glutamate--2,6-diaminopimelate ligase [Anaerococcus]MBS6106460.1 UDP-N-acetylmuramoyl-L-alanyl-D-glutamate--2,6-diaminopimelate ligase [Anaerococcus sp.]MDU2598908.1 UDP-N-acetylmuramoyl-L-alanyl-D-glutamate--2,6-diaminopimelate ligase [Anaerococcus sp.]PKZ16635.1 UDP-N-acetylmuramoyl-L-alanyl-D-glutamate--2,6-diaminopimelate ligase [Anaerococcus octavius]